MAKVNRPLRSVYLFALLPLLIFGLFWGLTGDVLASAVIAAIVSAAVPFVVATTVVCFLVPVVVHEAGHYFAGRREGFRFLVAAIGPWGWRREGERIVRFRHRPPLPGGYIAMSPTDEHDVERRFARFIAGGPLASLAWLGLVLAAWKLSGFPIALHVSHDSLLGGLGQLGFAVAAWSAFVMVPATLWPFRIKALGGLPSDMLRLLTLRRGGDEARALFAQLALQRMALSGVPLRDLPPHLLDDAERHPHEDAQKLAALQLRWGHQLNHDPQAAEATARRHGELVEKLRKGLPQEWIDVADLLQAEQAAYVRHDADAAEERLAGIETTAPPLQLAKATVEAAIAALRRAPDLSAKIDRAEAVLTDVVHRTSVDLDFERAWLAAMREGWPPEIDAPKSSASA